MTAYKIKYYRKGLLAFLFPVFFPDSIIIIIEENSEKAIERFYTYHEQTKYEIYDIKGVK